MWEMIMLCTYISNFENKYDILPEYNFQLFTFPMYFLNIISNNL